MDISIWCPSCKGAGQKTYGPVRLGCTACHGKGSIALPVDEVWAALRPYRESLKKHLIEFAKQRGLRSH